MSFHIALLCMVSLSLMTFAASLNHQRIERSVDTPTICLDPPDAGQCNKGYRNYFYNPSTGECEQFIWGGCGGNHNRFWTRDRCEMVCKPTQQNEDDTFLPQAFDTLIEGKDDCEYPSETGRCTGIFPRFYFDGEKCDFFVWGGCGGNPNNFLTEEACVERCMSQIQSKDEFLFQRMKRSSDIPKFCFDPPETGFCKAAFRNYFYNPVTRECEPFIWGGCGGNENKFWTQHDCEVVCKSKPSDKDTSLLQTFDTLIEGKDICEYPSDTGRCKKIFPRFYFDGTKCDVFMWGGCGGNPNNFITEEACIKRCMPESLNKGDKEDSSSLLIFDTLIEGKDDCEYPAETGRCRAFFPRFYFDGKKCDFFVWGGCGGNPNNFETEEACVERCMPGSQNPDLFPK